MYYSFDVENFTIKLLVSVTEKKYFIVPYYETTIPTYQKSSNYFFDKMKRMSCYSLCCCRFQNFSLVCFALVFYQVRPLSTNA